ncbi:hypothetical protein ACFE04_000770 [Oxalis oulophora]
MPTDSCENNNIRRPTPITGAPPPPEQDQLPCPRCDSTNTKFCYYNNYNFSQPRHFCKSCRRYWTHGGTLRDIPVGGGTRKNAKRCRTNNSGDPSGKCLVVNSFPATSATPVVLPVNQFYCGEGKMGSFSSLLDNNNIHGPGFLALSGFGLGIGPEYEEVGFGIGRVVGGGGGVWPFSMVADGGATVGMGNTWQLENGPSGFGSGDCWSDLAISTPGNCLK